VNLDANLPTGEFLSDEDIIEIVQGDNAEGDDDSDDEVQELVKPTVTRREGLAAMATVLRFAEQDRSVTGDQLLGLQRLIQQLSIPHGKQLKQTTLQNFFQKNRLVQEAPIG
jgi:hypothetical protein